jgi:hypothetical protein
MLERLRLAVGQSHTLQGLLQWPRPVAELLLCPCAGVPHAERGDRRVVAREPRFLSGKPGARFEKVCCAFEGDGWQRFSLVHHTNGLGLGCKRLSVRQIASSKNVAVAGIRFLQGEREGQRYVIDIRYGKPPDRMPRYLIRSQVEHRVSERVVKAPRAIQYAWVQNDNANAVAHGVESLFFREPLRLVVKQF